MTGREFAGFILPRYGFRKDAADLILRCCEFTLVDPSSIVGGGSITYTLPCRVTFATSQAEAAVHELAHAWWYLQFGKYIQDLLTAFLREADEPLNGYARVRELCREYRTIMWHEEQGRYHHDEVWAGLASATMGDLSLYPLRLRALYGRMYQEPYVSYLPKMTA